MNVRKMISLISAVWLVLGFTNIMNVAGHTSVIDPSSQVPTKLVLSAPTVAIGWGVYITGDAYLTTESGFGIGNATIHVQTFTGEGGSGWTTFLNVTTGADGHVSFDFAPLSSSLGTIGTYFINKTFRVTYDGDNQYAPSVSNEVVMHIKW